MSGRYLHAIDPGLDELVCAVFDLDGYLALTRGTLTSLPHPRVMTSCVHVARIRSAAGARPADRAQALLTPLREVYGRYPAAHVVVECPSNLVPYGGHTGQSVAQLALAIGAVLGATEGTGLPWSTLLPDRAPAGYKNVKAFRKERVHELCAAAEAPKPRSQDVVDALWTGIRWLAFEGARLPRPARRVG